MDSTYQDFSKAEDGGSGPPEPPENNTTYANPPYPRPNFSFLATMAANRHWLVMNVIAVPRPQYPIPKHPEKLLPKFDPDNDVTPEDHIKHFILSLRLLDVQHEDVVFRLFPYTFVGQASTWFFNVVARYIASWQQFETTFLYQFGDDRTVDGSKNPLQQRGSLPIAQVPIRLMNVWYGTPDEIMDPLPSRG